MNTLEYIRHIIGLNGAAYFILIDPDKTDETKLAGFVKRCERDGVDGFLVGGSLLFNGDLAKCISTIKANSSLPAIIFPGGVEQVVPGADAIFFLSLISGRNAEHLIGKHVTAAPFVKKYRLETISIGYMLIESGRTTTAQYMSGSSPIPAHKPEIAAATALAGQYIGMQMIYLEGGSGAQQPVPNELVRAVSGYVDVPVIVGGGIRTPEAAGEKAKSGAGVIVTGNYLENEDNWGMIKQFADAVHFKNVEC